MPLGRYWATRGKDDKEITEQRVLSTSILLEESAPRL